MFDSAPGTLQPIDIEDLVQWAFDQSITPALRGVSERSLMFDYGYTCIPKGCGSAFSGGGVVLEGGRRAVDIDADRVLRALDRLDPFTRAIVQANARAKRRPDWMEGVKPRLVTITRRHKRKHRRIAGQRWEPCSPEAVRSCRELYARWHAGLRHLHKLLNGTLLSFEINGFGAPDAPWENADEIAA